MKLMEKNETALREKYREVLEELEKRQETENVIFIETQNRDKIIGVQKDGRIWRLNSIINPQQAAVIYASRYKIRLYGIYFVFGFSDGRHLREMLKQCDDTNRIVVCEPDIDIFAVTCNAFDISDLLEDERVYLYIPKVAREIDSILSEVIAYENAGIVEFCILPDYDLLYKEICEDYMESLIEKIRNTLVHRGTYMLFNRMVPQHTFYNMKHMIKQRNYEQLKRALKEYDLNDIPAIIVSAGPSLDKNVQELKRAQGKAFIVVVDAALRTVLKAGIRPDMVCTVDPESPNRFFEDLNLKDMNWSCIRLTRPWILEQGGETVFYYGFFETSWNILLNNMLGYSFPEISTGGSVSSAAFMLSYLLGFKKLILVGQDMAFTNGISHTKGINEAFGDNDEYIKSRFLVQVEGNDGSILDTDFQMWYYKQWFERMIKKYEGEFVVLNATEGGAKIEGTEIVTLKAAIDRECRGQLDVYEIAQNIPPMFSETQQQHLMNELKGMMDKSETYRKQITETVAHQKESLNAMQQQKLTAIEIKNCLEKMLAENDRIKEIPLFEMMVLYSKEAEYEVGNDIYAKEDMSVEDIIERSIRLNEDYLHALEMMKEDFEEYVIKD